MKPPKVCGVMLRVAPMDNTLEVVEGKNSFEGTTPAAKSGYTFDGWYQDAECTIPVREKGTVDDATGKLKPERSELLPAPLF